MLLFCNIRNCILKHQSTNFLDIIIYMKLLNEEGDVMNDIVESNEVVQFKDGDFIIDVKISSKGKTVWLNQVLTAIESIYFLNSCFLLCV